MVQIPIPYRPDAGPDRAAIASSGRADSVDWNFVNHRESAGGISRLDGYVPANKAGAPYGQSGVTIGNGVDLGKRSASSLKELGLDQALVDILKPYLGLKQEAAQRALARRPLNLTRDQATALDLAVRQHELAPVVTAFDRASTVGRFYDLPVNTQTAITSLYFQYGSAGAPKFHKLITTGQWEAAYHALLNFGDAYGPRRKLEAELLLKDIKAGILPHTMTRASDR